MMNIVMNERLVLVFNDPNCGMDFELKLPDVSKFENKYEMSMKMKMFIYRFVYPLFTGAYYMLISGENVVDSIKYDKSKAVIDDYLQWVDTDMTPDDRYLIINFCKENGIEISDAHESDPMYVVISDIYEYVLKRTEYIYAKNKNLHKRLSSNNNK
nr:MAG TPA: hypothetical protein [Caudoviricetes sp.]